MKIYDYIKTASRPRIYEPGTAFMWDDEHISKQLLAVHLNPDIDLASRKPATILSTIDWVEKNFLKPGSSILDMGCGPGLYAEHFAARGYDVTGVDVSANSIEYAKGSALKNGFDIRYSNQNYLDLDARQEFDFIFMVFTDFSVLVPQQRKKVLDNIYTALKPGGLFCFDFLNDSFPIAEVGTREWDICDGGFWKKEPYLVLNEKLYYPEENVCLSQHVVADTSGAIDLYRFWTHAFNRNRIRDIISSYNFSTCSFHENILSDCEFYNASEISFCVAGK